MKRSKTFEECDDTRGWEIDISDIRDHRLCKHLRQHQSKISKTPLPHEFKVIQDVHLPKTMLVDLDAVAVEGCEPITIDRGDVYEGFWRTSEMTLRGIFVNNEPVWGEAGYRNGMSYVGSLSGGLAHGFGVKRQKGSVYKGRFEEGLRHGRGILVEATRFRLYAGTFYKDKPQGPVLCIEFSWCDKTRTVQHTRKIAHFDNGVVQSSDKAPNVNVSVLSGLAPEEFLQLYRETEKLVEDSMVRDLLQVSQADEILWTPIGM
jgi:hypothetical protein